MCVCELIEMERCVFGKLRKIKKEISQGFLIKLDKSTKGNGGAWCVWYAGQLVGWFFRRRRRWFPLG